MIESQKIKGSINTNTTVNRSHHKNDAFYIAKRGLFRKAEGVGKKHNSDVFIVVHQRENDKLYCFSNENNFSLERVT